VIILTFGILLFFIFTTTAHAQVVISEVYPAPTSEEKEWIELYNQSEESIDIVGWKLYEHFSSKNELVIFNIDNFENTNIEGYEYFIFELPSNKLNNSEEKVSLENLINQEVSSLHFTNSESQKSYSYSFSDQFNISTVLKLNEPSKGYINQIIPDQTPTPSPSTIINQTPTPEPENPQPATPPDNPDNKTDNQTKDNENVIQKLEPINHKLNQYVSINKKLSLPTLTLIEKEGLEKRVPQFSYLIQKHVSKQGVINAIIGGTLIIFIGFIL
jgi:hypothetical protein